MTCGSNTLVIGRPSKASFENACRVGGVTASVGNCNTASCWGVFDRRFVQPRKNREKVREAIKDYVLLMLGAPRVKVELESQGLDLCVDQSLQIFETYAGREYFEYYTFNTTPGVSVYQLPDDIGIVRNVFYKEQANFAFQSQDLGGTIPVDYFYPGGGYGGAAGVVDPVQPVWGRAGEWTLYKMYEQLYSNISSQIGGWEWLSDQGHIKLYPTPCGCCRVSVHYMQKCKDFREVTQAMTEGALAHAYIMLGNIRGKYTNLPGPGGGVQLDGEHLRTKGWELKEKWEENLITKYGDLLPITLG